MLSFCHSFPFSDLSTTKRRPALVIAALADTDVILLTAEQDEIQL
jgi:hypothetical protein